jgi:hypothetical protein
MRRRLLLAALAIVVLWPAAAAAERTSRHSGTLVALDASTGRLVLDEVGPRREQDGRTVVRRLRMRITPVTRFVLVRRDHQARYAGAFTETELTAADLGPGDYITVECERKNGRLIVLLVTAAELEE